MTEVTKVEHNTDLAASDAEVKKVAEKIKELRKTHVERALRSIMDPDAPSRLFEVMLPDTVMDHLANFGRLDCGGYDFHAGLVEQIKEATGGEHFALEALASSQPQDAFEGLLVTQMVATHQAAMKALARLHSAPSVTVLEAHNNGANKLLRTFAAQMEALRKHRTKGTQVVKHVHVSEGGQAIVADTVNSGGTGNEQK